MIEGLHYFTLADQTHGEVHLAVVVPKGGDPWGVLAPIRETPWGRLVAKVSGEAMAHARHGYATPLMREIGAPPNVVAQRITSKEGMCAQMATCPVAGPGCRPGKKLPDCYEPPGISDVATLRLVTSVSLAWRDGRYVVVVIGSEFNIQ